MQRGLQPVSQSTNTVFHYQESLPPYPCKIYLICKITNAFLWYRDCLFKSQILDQNQILSQTINQSSQERPTAHESQLEHYSLGSANNTY